jgi:hypothetical protein
MHTYVGSIFFAWPSSLPQADTAPQGSSFRRKYADEDPVVLSHLHVMALQKFVLLKMGRVEELKHVAAGYRASKNLAYKRAWEIVDQVEDYQAFVKELKDFAARHK